MKSELRISTIVDGRDGFRGARCFHCFQRRFPLRPSSRPPCFRGTSSSWGQSNAEYADFVASIIEVWYILVLNLVLVSRVLTAPSRQFYWQYKRSEVAQRQRSCSVAGWQRLAWRCEACEDDDIWRLRGEQFEFETPLSRDIALWYIYCPMLVTKEQLCISATIAQFTIWSCWLRRPRRPRREQFEIPLSWDMKGNVAWNIHTIWFCQLKEI